MTKKHKPNPTSRQTQAGIVHSTPAHRGGQVQNRMRQRQQLRVKKHKGADRGAVLISRNTGPEGEGLPALGVHTGGRIGDGGCAQFVQWSEDKIKADPFF